MLKVEKILPVVLVSVAAILALAFMLTHFAEQMTAQASFELNPVLQKYQSMKPLSISTKEVCVFTNPGIDCKTQQNANNFCYLGMGISVNQQPTATQCTSGYITCELPCGTKGANCGSGVMPGEYSVKKC